jgi:DNA polymerase III delta prime subunit
MFATFTFKSDRDNIQKSKDKMSQWLQSQQKISKFRYLIVAEYHKDKKAIHFHALLGGYKGKLTEAKNKKTGKIIYNKHGNVRYNINSYQSGYTTLDLIQTKKAKKLVSSYIRKYISKDMILDASKQRYWCSQNLNRPKITKAKYYDNQLQLGALQLVYENDIFQLYESSDKIETLFNKKAEQWQISQLTKQLKVKLRIKSTSSTWTHDSLKRKTVEPSITFD